MEVNGRALGILVALAVASTGATFFMRIGAVNRGGASTAERTAASALGDSVTLLAAKLRAEQVRALVDSASRRPDAPAFMVLGDSLPGDVIRRAWELEAALGLPEAPAVPFRMAVLDGHQLLAPTQSSFSRFALLPEAGGSPACTAVQIYFPRRDGREEETLDSPNRWWPVWHGAVGPCWYAATYGLPGPAVRAWLDARYWDVAGEIPGHRRRMFSARDVHVFPKLLDRLVGEFVGAMAGGSATLEGCLADRPDLCEAALLDRPYIEGLLPDRISGSQSAWVRVHAERSWALGMPQWASTSLLAMMVEDLGPERFEAFWSSDLQVPEAFTAAVGMSLGQWYRLQVLQELREAGMDEPTERTSWPSSVGLLLLVLVATLSLGRYRQVR